MDMDIPDQASIVLVDTIAEVKLLWKGFDGDDSFAEHSIEVLAEGKSSRHDFGGCAVNGLRKVTRLLRSDQDGKSEHGFRNPDPIFYSLERRKDEMTLSIQNDRGRLVVVHRLKNPIVRMDGAFLAAYDGDRQ